jgi:transaldolase
MDWYKAKGGGAPIPPELDPGVSSVRNIYQYYKEHGYPTTVMGASFRNVGEIIALAGCDRLTISPKLLEELQNSEAVLERRLQYGGAVNPPPAPMTEPEFRWAMNEDAMATDKLAEGIRGFAADQIKLESLLAERL